MFHVCLGHIGPQLRRCAYATSGALPGHARTSRMAAGPGDHLSCGIRWPASRATWRNQTMLDAIDTRIVECLQVDGRASWTQIARQIGVPTSTAFRRGTALLEGNAILIATLPTLETYPEESRVYELRVRCRRGAVRSVARRLADRPDARWVAAVTGEFDVSAELVVPQSADLGEIIIDQIQGDPDILAVDTTM